MSSWTTASMGAHSEGLCCLWTAEFNFLPESTFSPLLISASSHRESLVSLGIVDYLVSSVTLEMKASRAPLEKR